MDELVPATPSSGRFWRFRAVVAFITVLGGCSDEPPWPDEVPVGDYTALGDYLDWRLEQVVADDNVPAVAVSLIDDQEVVYSRVLGKVDLDGGGSATRDTVWRVGSVTKLFTALGVLKLMEDGDIDLDEPAITWVPDLEQLPAGDTLTVRQLLAHRSGLPRNCGLPGWYWEIGDEDLFDHQTAATLEQPPAALPGERYHYSNAGYNLVAQISEEASGVPWPSLLSVDVLRPIGMSGSEVLRGWLPPEAVVAAGYAEGKEGLEPYIQHDDIGLASGNLYSPLGDLEAFASWVFRDGDGVLAPETLEASFEPQFARPRDPEEHGLGWETSRRRFDEPLVFHTGTMHGTRSIVALLPESRLGVVAIGTSDLFESVANEVAIVALERMRQTRGDPVPSPEREETVHVERDVLDLYTGLWAVGGDFAEVYRDGGRLMVRYQGTKRRLKPLARDRFVLHHWLFGRGDVTVRFDLGSDGEPDLMLIDLARMDYDVGYRYDVGAVTEEWQQLAGRYLQRPRLESEHLSGLSWKPTLELTEEGALRLPGMPLLPVSDTTLRVRGGQWHGETVFYDPEERTLTHGSNTWTYDGPPPEPESGCGCALTPGSSWWIVGILPVFGRRRR